MTQEAAAAVRNRHRARVLQGAMAMAAASTTTPSHWRRFNAPPTSCASRATPSVPSRGYPLTTAFLTSHYARRCKTSSALYLTSRRTPSRIARIRIRRATRGWRSSSCTLSGKRRLQQLHSRHLPRLAMIRFAMRLLEVQSFDEAALVRRLLLRQSSCLRHYCFASAPLRPAADRARACVERRYATLS